MEDEIRSGRSSVIMDEIVSKFDGQVTLHSLSNNSTPWNCVSIFIVRNSVHNCKGKTWLLKIFKLLIEQQKAQHIFWKSYSVFMLKVMIFCRKLLLRYSRNKEVIAVIETHELASYCQMQGYLDFEKYYGLCVLGHEENLNGWIYGTKYYDHRNEVSVDINEISKGN